MTRALLRGAKWVKENPKEASELSVEKQFVPSGKNILEINTQALLKLDYTPGVKRCRESVDEAAADMKRAGLLKPQTDPAALAKKIWLDLDGVTDDWINGLKVEKTAAVRPALLDPGISPPCSPAGSRVAAPAAASANDRPPQREKSPCPRTSSPNPRRRGGSGSRPAGPPEAAVSPRRSGPARAAPAVAALAVLSVHPVLAATARRRRPAWADTRSRPGSVRTRRRSNRRCSRPPSSCWRRSVGCGGRCDRGPAPLRPARGRRRRRLRISGILLLLNSTG